MCNTDCESGCGFRWAEMGWSGGEVYVQLYWLEFCVCLCVGLRGGWLECCRGCGVAGTGEVIGRESCEGVWAPGMALTVV